MYFYRETKIGNFSGKDRFSLSKSERITTDAPTGNKLYYNWIRKCYRKFPESAIFAGVTVYSYELIYNLIIMKKITQKTQTTTMMRTIQRRLERLERQKARMQILHQIMNMMNTET